jgi:hypothetical protein
MYELAEILKKLFYKIVATLLLCFITKWAWNETMPYLFGLPTITYWKMVGVQFLANMLLRSSLNNNDDY